MFGRCPSEAGWTGNEDHGDNEYDDGWESEGENEEDGVGDLFMGMGEGERWVDEGEGAVVRGDFPESSTDCCDGSV